MFKAYVKTDPLENPEVISDLRNRLQYQGISLICTQMNYKEILSKEPFLWFRNPYIRFNNEINVIKHHHNHKNIPYIKTKDDEIISFNPLTKLNYPFILDLTSYLYEPKIEALPILLGTHQRATYLQLTLNSLLYSCQPTDKVYLVVSQPDPETESIVKKVIQEKPQVEAVISKENLKYSFANFGSKYFGLKKFIHYEDDGILPESFSYQVPFWTKQLNYRSTTADYVVFRVFDGNWHAAFYKCAFYATSNLTKIPDGLWFYTTPSNNSINPFGIGFVVDSEKMYKNFMPPNYCVTDHSLYHSANNICVLNIPIYHIGANFPMDYPQYHTKKSNTQVEKLQQGNNLRTGEIKDIDLGLDWGDTLKKS